MFRRIQEYGLMSTGTRLLRPRVYGDPLADGSWAGWVVFFPVAGGVAIAPPGPETTQPSLAALEVWAAGLHDVYLEGALERAQRVATEPPVIAHLTDAEYQALEDAARLESAADLERAAAKVDEAAARAARADAEQIRQERANAEKTLAALDEQAATADAKMHEEAAREARAGAADARQRRRAAQAKGRPKSQPPRRRKPKPGS